MRQSFYLFLSLATLAASSQLSAQSHIFGGKTTVTCDEDDSVRVCNAGTQGCFDNGDICDMRVGYEKEITCRDASVRYCNAGTQHCYNNDEVMCAKKEQGNGFAQKHILGGKTTVTCDEDDSVRVCSAGTQGCYDNGDICDEAFGYETQITCKDGTKRFCAAGTRHCTDNDAKTCSQKPNMNGFAQTMYGEKVAVKCQDGSVRACNSGTQGCYENGDVCDIEVGYETQISCPDGSKQFCNVGTATCFNDNKVMCNGHMGTGLAQTNILGKKTAIKCADGSLRVCNAGTQGCAKTGSVCDPNKVGYETQISCPDGSTKYCQAGTRDCRNGNPKICGASDVNGVLDWPVDAGVGPVIFPNGHN